MGNRQSTRSLKQLLIIDGIPGSGKTSTAIRVHHQMKSQGFRTNCLLEQMENNPLLPQMEQYHALQTSDGAEDFIKTVVDRYEQFVVEQLHGPDDIIIIESVMFQDVVSVSHLQGMNLAQLQKLTQLLQSVLMPLNPILIYYYHVDVEKQWRYICGIRGNKWGPVSFQTDDDFVQAGQVWSARSRSDEVQLDDSRVKIT